VKGASGPAWSAERAIQALPGQARGRLDERPPDRVEATPVLALPHHDAALLFGGADVLLLDSDLPPIQWLRGDLHWEPPRAPPIEKCPSWHFDLWHYKFPSGDLILNPEALDSIRPLE
jgi:hypothetical protein